jgi:O-antigen/teichoic acid export membrane protein
MESGRWRSGGAASAAQSRVTRNAASLAAATVVARACALVLAVAMGRGLGVAEYGRYGFAAAIGAIILPLADLGVTSYVWREVARNRSTGDAQAAYLARVKYWFSLSALAITVAAAMLLSASVSAAAVVIVVVAAALADGTSAFVYGYFQGREQMGFQARWIAGGALLRSIGGVCCVALFGRLLAVAVWVLAVSAVQLAFALRRFLVVVGHDARRRPGRRLVSWRAVLAMGALTLSVLAYLNGDTVLIGIIKDRHAVGLYAAALAIVAAAQLVPWQISQAIAPVFARTHGADPAGFGEAWEVGLRVVLLIALPTALVIAILARGVLRLPYGVSFTPAATALSVLIWSSPIAAVNSLVAGALLGVGREGWAARVSVGAVVLNLGLNVWAIPTFGIVGAAVVTVVTELAVLVGQTRFLIAHGIVSFPRLRYGRTAVALLALAAVAIELRSMNVIAAAVPALVIYGLMTLFTGALRRSELRDFWTAIARAPAPGRIASLNH